MKTDTKFIIFKIDNKQALIIKNLCSDGDHLYRWDPVDIIFKNENAEYIISQHDYLMPQLEDFYFSVQEAIENKLPLLTSMKGNLGYLRNQDSTQNNVVSFEKYKNFPKSEIPLYIMWGGNKFETWLYNQNNKIYLEIIPLYEWAYRDPEDGEFFTPLDEWIKNYKPLVIIEIDKVTAQQWFDQAGELMKIIEAADEKYLHTLQELPETLISEDDQCD